MRRREPVWLASLLIPLMGLLLLSILMGSQIHVHASANATVAFTHSPTRPDINTPVTFDASAARSPNGAIKTYEWDFDGDGQFDLSTSDVSVTHLLDRSGDLAVTLRITDTSGSAFSATQNIPVASAPVLVRRVVSTPLSPNRVAAGSSFQVTVTIQANETINGLGLDEDPPDGWRVSLADGAGAVYKSSDTQFLWLETINPGQTRRVIYNVTVPSGATPGLYNLVGRTSSFSPRFKIDVVGDTQVQVF